MDSFKSVSLASWAGSSSSGMEARPARGAAGGDCGAVGGPDATDAPVDSPSLAVELDAGCGAESAGPSSESRRHTAVCSDSEDSSSSFSSLFCSSGWVSDSGGGKGWSGSSTMGVAAVMTICATPSPQSSVGNLTFGGTGFGGGGATACCSSS